MTTKGFIAAWMSVFLAWAGCTIPKHVPSPEAVDADPYGSEIHIRLTPGQYDFGSIKGELLAADSACLLILPYKSKTDEALVVQLRYIESYKLFYAKPRNYLPTIPLFALMTFSHGVFMLISLPVNIIATTATTCKAANAFIYRKGDLTPDQLRMFSRYPQYKPEDLPVTGYR